MNQPHLPPTGKRNFCENCVFPFFLWDSGTRETRFHFGSFIAAGCFSFNFGKFCPAIFFFCLVRGNSSVTLLFGAPPLPKYLLVLPTLAMFFSEKRGIFPVFPIILGTYEIIEWDYTYYFNCRNFSLSIFIIFFDVS